ncbi:hypothetical protein KUA11_16080 [Acetobacter estunensis]|nr:hypothetical protein [Acetobacter estunensis]
MNLEKCLSFISSVYGSDCISDNDVLLISGTQETSSFSDNDFSGIYIHEENFLSLDKGDVNIKNLHNVIIKSNLSYKAILLYKYISVFKTEYLVRSFLGAIVGRKGSPCIIIEDSRNVSFINRFRRLCRVLDLESICIPVERDNISMYVVNARRKNIGFGAVINETRDDILKNSCGVTNTKLYSPNDFMELLSTQVHCENPFSFIRFNHCEPRISGFPYLFSIEDAIETTELQWGQKDVSIHDIAKISSQLLNCVRNADMMGIPDIQHNAGDKLSILSNSCYVLFRDFRLFSESTKITNVNIHIKLGMMADFYELLKVPKKLVLVSGRDVSRKLQDKLNRSNIKQITIPQEFRHRETENTIPHFPHLFRHISEEIRKKAGKGTMFLVGAGILGKIYCDIARNNGSIALDIGSLFDAWDGKATRGRGFPDGISLK